ncbi:MAG TPA: AAA family ATPase [Microvirga sp.]|jgi:DNA-binding CsgD family transcriptional regulator/energy-coupling factor transporter ATP-binding protein EcfA2|nr:AAA family ATPase [Microvirga sp.]
MHLLERRSSLEELEQCARDLSGGEGRIALVSGEAGLGKTSLIEHFAALLRRRQRVFLGRCDSLYTPTPLSPFHEIAEQIGGELLAVLELGPSSSRVVPRVVQVLQRIGPAIVVLEDLHWADEVSLDVIKYLARRPGTAELLFILTYRDDELSVHHPLRSLLGVLATCRTVSRIPLRPLSLEAVRELIGEEHFDAGVVYRQTSGNPFLVTELLASGKPDHVPEAVRDIVLQRAGRLSPAARRVLEAAAVIGARCDASLLWQIVGDDAAQADDCVDAGLLRIEGSTLALRHELTRQAVLNCIAPIRRMKLHDRVLRVLEEGGGADASLLAHHAEAAGNAEAVRRHAPAAARQAQAIGSHREAAAQFERALRHTASQPTEVRALILEALAGELALLDQQSKAAETRRAAVRIWSELGDLRKEGENLAALAWPLVRSGQNTEADESCSRAVKLLKGFGISRELAAAMRMKAHLRMLNRDKHAAIAWGHKAMAMAAAVGDPETVASANMVVGSAMLVADDQGGRVYLDRSIALAEEHGFDGIVALALLNIGSSYGEQYHLAEADQFLQRGLAYARERDLDHAGHYISAWLALTSLHQGRWSEAADLASEVLQVPELAVVSRIMALVALGRIRTRRGDPGAWALLDEALDLASRTATLQRLAPVRAARAEAALLSGDHRRAQNEAEAAWDLAIRHRHPWHAGEFAFWRKQAGADADYPSWVAHPYLLQLQGKWQDAALAWEKRGCPYEQARALEAGGAAACRAALVIYDRLGARPAADALRQRLRREGAAGVPRGPRSVTRGNQYGLTARQAQILSLLMEGLTNSRIAHRLHISAKTVDHHVSAVLGKLGVSSRAEVARLMRGSSGET